MRSLSARAVGVITLCAAFIFTTKVRWVDDKVVEEYVGKHLKMGFSEEQIRKEMKAAGIGERTAERVLRKMLGKNNP